MLKETIKWHINKTGKTTLSKLLAGRLKWRYLPEAPAQALIKGFELNENTSLESEIWIIAKKLIDEKTRK